MVTAPPVLLGGRSRGSVLVVDLGTYEYEPSEWTFQWNVNGAVVPGATGRWFDTTGHAVGDVVTCALHGTNSISVYDVETPGKVLTAARGVKDGYRNRAIRFEDTSNTSQRTRIMLDVSPGDETPLDLLVLSAFVGLANTSATAYPTMMTLGAASSPVLPGSLKALSQGGRPYATAAFRAQSAAAATSVQHYTETRCAAWAMAAFDLADFNIAGALIATAGARLEASTDPDASPAIGSTFAFRSGEQAIIPKGWLVIAIGVAGRQGEPAPLEWGVETTAEAFAFADVVSGNDYARDASNNRYPTALSIVKAIQPETGPITLELSAGIDPENLAMTVLAIPPK